MRLLKIFSLLMMLSLIFGSCKKLLNPENDDHSLLDRTYNDPAYAEGLLMDAYARIPTNSLTFNDVATDDAVSNDKLNSYLRVATGQWSALYNPLNQYDNCNMAILYLNDFMNRIDTVPWKWTSAVVNAMFIQRFKGEAFALRGLFQYHLLQTIGGVGANDALLGIPLYNKFIKVGDNLNVPRAGFTESVQRIIDDYDSALVYLTMDNYKDVTSASQLPPGFTGVNTADYNLVFGNVSQQRISGRIVNALKARIALLAASPAFSPTSDVNLWARAANFAGTALNGIGGISGLDPVGNKWYLTTYVNALSITSGGADQKEIIWRRPRTQSNTREIANFPPSLFGSGNTNPTQNLVDAFPMANGYPITTADTAISHYNPVKPYATNGNSARDPRLALYITYNGSSMKSTVITTGVGGGANAKDSVQTSTRTGYYMKKLLVEAVNANPVSLSTQNHYEVHMRYTELFLIYAEAANEAWGPNGKGTFTFSARDVIAAIRKRAGISQPDNYLASITTQADMRTLIRNERRLELCFEGFRFWDLRRWKANLTETAKGVNINRTGTTFAVVNVESRVYNDYMYYGPLPQTEILKFNALIQNKGW